MSRLLQAVALLAVGVMPAQAADPSYLDDRSSPEALIRSLYNAVERKEYARAWSYFAEKPAASLDAYAEGYADTDTVIVRTGPAGEEGAAGSVHYSLPVAIEARTADGDMQVYGGCYELRLANPQIQSEDFAPLHIVRGALAPSSDSVEQAVPARCGDAPAPDPSELLDRKARAVYEDAFASTCMIDEAEKRDPENFSRWDIDFAYSYEDAGAPTSKAHLFRFLCNRGAYNESHVYIQGDAYGLMRPLGFATPELDIRYQDDDFEKPVEAIYVKGFRSAAELVNSDFDPAVMTLSSWSKWRGVGDASAIGTWIFRDGEFALVRYEVDATYDGEIEHQSVVDYLTGP